MVTPFLTLIYTAGYMRISLAMIVKNEALGLQRAMASVGQAVDEIVVVDTGSTDDSISIARAAGAAVIETEFVDFSQARNRAIGACTGDWILMLDGDESFGLSPAAVIREATSRVAANDATCRDADYKGYYLLRWNFLNDPNEVSFTDHCLRLFRNAPGIGFRYRVHERIEPSLDALAGRYGTLNTIPISHHVYDKGPDFERGKRERYVEALKADICDYPADPGRWDHLGCEYIRLERWADAVTSFRRQAELAPRDPAALISLASALELTGQLDEATVARQKAQDLDNRNQEPGIRNQ